MATFLVVHGAWTRGWSWRKMHEPLRTRGHLLLTPTLTGLGERAHLASPNIDLETHVADILGVIRCEDLRDIILLGHSYGGMVATVLAARVPDRVSLIVYFDAFVLQDGECLLDLLPPGQADRMRDAAAREGDGWKFSPIRCRPTRHPQMPVGCCPFGRCSRSPPSNKPLDSARTRAAFRRSTSTAAEQARRCIPHLAAESPDRRALALL